MSRGEGAAQGSRDENRAGKGAPPPRQWARGGEAEREKKSARRAAGNARRKPGRRQEVSSP